MPPVQPLANVVDQFTAEVDEIDSIFAASRGCRSVGGFAIPYMPHEDGCLVSLWDAWTRYLRGLALAGALGDCLGLSGTVYAQPAPRSEPQALADMAANRRGNNFRIIGGEPKWNDPLCLADIVNFLTLANGNIILSAVGSNVISLGPVTVPNPLEEIRICRNFVAHKSDGTLADVRAYARGPFVDLSTHLRGLRSGVEAFSEWRDCLAALAVAAAQ